jgi:hypothetical protein
MFRNPGTKNATQTHMNTIKSHQLKSKASAVYKFFIDAPNKAAYRTMQSQLQWLTHSGHIFMGSISDSHSLA